jgi:hypothetical protein
MKPLRFAIATSVLSLAGIIVACSEEKEDPDLAAQADFVKTYCQIIVPCCQSALNLPPGQEACEKRVRETDSVVVKDQRARTDCIAQLRNLTPKNDFCTEFGNLEQPACPDIRRKVSTGAKKPGEPCATNAECAPSFDGPVTCNTVCQVSKRGKEGDGPCTMTIEGDIQRPLKDAPAPGASSFICYATDKIYCDSEEKKCVKPLALAAACTRDEQCEKTAYCDPNTNKCANRKAVGNACTIDAQCARTAHCKDTFCVADDLDEGADCEKDELCKTDFCSGGKCVKALPDARLTVACVDTKDGG